MEKENKRWHELGHQEKLNLLMDQLAIEREEIKILRDRLAEEEWFNSDLYQKNKNLKITLWAGLISEIIMAFTLGAIL